MARDTIGQLFRQTLQGLLGVLVEIVRADIVRDRRTVVDLLVDGALLALRSTGATAPALLRTATGAGALGTTATGTALLRTAARTWTVSSALGPIVLTTLAASALAIAPTRTVARTLAVSTTLTGSVTHVQPPKLQVKCSEAAPEGAASR